MVETLVRLKGELISAGFETEILDGADGGGERGRRLARPPRAAGGPARGRRGGRHRRRSLARFRRGLGDRQGDGQVGRAPGAVRTRGHARVRDAGDPGDRAAALELSRDRSGGARSAQRARAPRRRPPSSISWRRNGWRDTPNGSASRSAAPGSMSLDGVGPALLPLVRFDWSLRSVVSRRRRRWPGLGTRPNVESAGGQRAGGAGVWTARRQLPFPRGRAGASLRDAVRRRAAHVGRGARRRAEPGPRRGAVVVSRRRGLRCVAAIARSLLRSRWRPTRSSPSRISPFASWTQWSRRPRGRTCS